MRTRKGLDWTEDFAAIAQAASALDRYLIVMSKKLRTGRIFLDFLRK